MVPAARRPLPTVRGPRAAADFRYNARAAATFRRHEGCQRDLSEPRDPLMAVWDSAAQETRPPHSHPWLADGLFALDARLRRNYAVFEYTRNPACVFRLDISRAARPLALGDGTRVAAGQRIARLHFWNEQVPTMPAGGATIAWARRLRQAIATSLGELAGYLRSRPEFDDVAVICADVPSGTRTQSEQLARIMSRYGFEAIVEGGRLSAGARLHRLGENILISLIVFAQNAGALRRDTLRRVRVPIYLSRRRLEEKFGSRGEPAAATAVAP